MVEGAIKEYEVLFFLTCFVLISQTYYFYYLYSLFLYCHHLIKKKKKNWTVRERYFAIKVTASGPQGMYQGTALWTPNFYDFHIIFSVIFNSSVEGDNPDP